MKIELVDKLSVLLVTLIAVMATICYLDWKVSRKL